MSATIDGWRLAVALEDQWLTVAEVGELLGSSDKVARHRLRALVDAGLVVSARVPSDGSAGPPALAYTSPQAIREGGGAAGSLALWLLADASTPAEVLRYGRAALEAGVSPDEAESWLFDGGPVEPGIEAAWEALKQEQA